MTEKQKLDIVKEQERLRTNGEIFNEFKSKYPDLKVKDYRPFWEGFAKNKAGVTIWFENGDMIFYFPEQKETNE